VEVRLLDPVRPEHKAEIVGTQRPSNLQSVQRRPVGESSVWLQQTHLVLLSVHRWPWASKTKYLWTLSKTMDPEGCAVGIWRKVCLYIYIVYTKASKHVGADLIYLLTAVGLTPGGISSVHIYTQTVHRTTQLIWKECEPCPVFVSYTLAFALQLRKKARKTLSQGSRRVSVENRIYRTEHT
jgi:hypothetical protein